MNLKSKLSSTDEKIKFLEWKIFDQSQSIDKPTINFENVFQSTKNHNYLADNLIMKMVSYTIRVK